MEQKQVATLKVAECVGSPTNPRIQKDFAGAEFNELVRSIKEKGVLVPVLARKVGKKYEVIAGNRRLAAAKEAGIEEIPANVVVMNDSEAREAQIVENMQRKDVHPLDEGEAFRFLVEELNHDAEGVAKRVGKSVTYVRERLGLTNLNVAAAKAFREGDITITHALLIAKLEDDKQQNDAVKETTRYNMSADRLRSWIQDRVYTDLGNRPWAKDAKLAELVGDDMGKETLFGKKPTDDPVEYARKMAAYIELMIRRAAEKKEKLVKICTSYGTPDLKGVLGRDQYKMLESKEAIKKATNPHKGIVAEGGNMGRIFWITTAKEDLQQSESSTYRLSPAEKAKRKKEREAADKKRAKDHVDTQKAVGRMSWPISQKHLDALVDIAISQASHDTLQGICKRRELEAEKYQSHNGRNYQGAVQKLAGTLKPKEKAGLMLELMLPGYSPHWDGRSKWLKRI